MNDDMLLMIESADEIERQAQEIAQLEAALDSEKIESATLRHGCDIYTRRILALELRLAAARNKALEEVVSLAESDWSETRGQFICEHIRALKTPISGEAA